jgi:proline iminopeptidase
MQRVVTLAPGRQATYEVVGHGEPMLWFQGGPGIPALLLRPDAELLADRFAIYLIDPHGSGGSTPPEDPSAYDHIGHARFYDEVRQALGLDQVSICGLSFGGTVALTYSALYPDHTLRCLAISPYALGTELHEEVAATQENRAFERHAQAPWFPEAKEVIDHWTERVLAAQDPAEVGRMFSIVFPLYFAHPERPAVATHIERIRQAAGFDLVAAKTWEGGLYQRIDLRPLLPQIRCPVLVITGDLDFICGPPHAEAVGAEVPQAQVVIIPDCGHIPEYEAPEAFRSAVLDWLRHSGPG